MGGEIMENIKGVVERITYHNEESGYSVIKVKVSGFYDLITFTGKFIQINVGSVIEAKGNFVINKKFGKQFNVTDKLWQSKESYNRYKSGNFMFDSYK